MLGILHIWEKSSVHTQVKDTQFTTKSQLIVVTTIFLSIIYSLSITTTCLVALLSLSDFVAKLSQFCKGGPLAIIIDIMECVSVLNLLKSSQLLLH